MDNLVDLVKNMSISGGLDYQNKDDENKLADPVGVILMSDRSAMQLDRNRS